MAQIAKECTASQLKRDGFKVAGKCKSLYVSQSGAVFCMEAGKYLKPSARHYIKTETEYLSVPKLILEAFAGVPYRSGQIVCIDGDRANLSIENVQYARIFPADKKPDPVNEENLLKALRCYEQLSVKFNIKESLQTCRYLKRITERRRFFVEKKGFEHIEVFQTFIIEGNLNKTALKHGLTVRDCAIVKGKYLNMLIGEIISDIERGILEPLPHKPERQTETQILREYNKGLIERGGEPLPLRKPSVRQQIKELKNILNEPRAQQTETDADEKQKPVH